MDALLHMLQFGVDGTSLNVLLFVDRVACGLFFAISGAYKLRDGKNIVATFKADGIPFIPFMRWFVPGVEFFGGLAVGAGILAPLAALGLIIILCVALCTDGPKRVKEYEPTGLPDVVDDWLYLSETTYVVLLLFVLIAGPGSFTLLSLLT